MRINGYKNNTSNYKKKCIKNNNCLNSLFEVENFLCNFKKIAKCINLYKFFK